MRVYLPWLGEFGTELLKYASAVFADPAPKIVCHELGKEPVYPVAARRIVVPRIMDADRKSIGSPMEASINQELIDKLGPDHDYIVARPRNSSVKRFFVPESSRPFEGMQPDVVLYPRRRSNVERKNWDGWMDVADRLTAAGIKVFAAGHPDSSYRLNCPAAWDYDQPLEASIQAIKRARVNCGMITALTVLALMCGKRPWVAHMASGAMAPRGHGGPNWDFLKRVDHLEVGWDPVPLLDDAQALADAILEALKT